MKTLISILFVMMMAGCGKTDVENLEAENRRIEAELREKRRKIEAEMAAAHAVVEKLKADLDYIPGGGGHRLFEELTPEEKKVVGTYELELKKFGETYRYVLLDNRIVEYYLDGKKDEEEHKWSIVDKEVHIERENRAVSVFSINKDESITGIATIDEDGKREEIPKEHQYTRKKIK